MSQSYIRCLLQCPGVALATLAVLLSGTACAQPRAPDDRMAAHHLTMVAVNETRPNAGLLTYVVDRFTQTEAYGLARLSVGAEVDGARLGPAKASEVVVKDVPGGVQATYRLGRVRIDAEVVPLLRGRGDGLWEGAAVYSVRATPPVPVDVTIGGSRVVGFQSPRAAWLQQDDATLGGDTATMQGSTAMLRSSVHPLAVAVRASSEADLGIGRDGRTALARFASGHGCIIVGYARDEARAAALAAADPVHVRREISDYYAGLLKACIRTPEPEMDAAFRSAITTLEYNWIAPIGWNECIHHWYSLWHMQHSPAAEWIGQADRARACILAHAEKLMPDGAAPQLSVDGRARRDFGGSNQFYAWQIRHYLRHTGDRTAAARLAPVLDRIIAQTWEEYDPDGNGLLAWGQQIGNQEDYVSTPNDGATPTIEGIQMLLARAEAAEMLADRRTALACHRRAEALGRLLREAFWQPDLGRFAFFRDALGVVRPDGQYHAYAYPAIWGTGDALDAWTSLRHMREALTGAGGEVYCSNNFPWHAVGTWGMQAGAAQQPWAAWALAAVGLRNEAYRPLLAAARWAMDANHRGAWPEISVESTPAYFSPPAGLYIQAVIEALFGLSVDATKQTLRVEPSFPDRWPAAELRLPGFRAVYARSGGARTYVIESNQPLRRQIRWMLPVGRIVAFTIDGRRTPYRIAAGVDCVALTSTTSASRRTVIRVVMAPLPVRVAHARSVAEGDTLRVRVEGTRIERVEDRAGVLASSAVSVGSDGSELIATVRDGLLRPYARFGRLGLMSFSRRAFFLHLRSAGIAIVRPVTVTVLPRYEASVAARVASDAATLIVRLRNNTMQRLAGEAILSSACGSFRVAADVPPRSEATQSVRLSADRLALLSPGDNAMSLRLPGGATLTPTCDASPFYEAFGELRAWAGSRLTAVALPEDLLQEDVGWRGWREWYAYGHWPWANSRPPLEASGSASEATLPDLPGVRFALAGRKMVPVSWRLGRPEVRLDLGGKPYRKLYVLVVPFVDNHDTFTPVARVTVRLANGGTRSRELCFPGDLDWWCPKEIVDGFATATGPRGDRFGLAPLLPVDRALWSESMPPAYPQPARWATCRVLATPSAVMNVVELDLGGALPVASLSIATIGSEAALGLVAVTAEAARGHASLDGTRFAPPQGMREPTPLFALTRVGDAEGWQTDGLTFTVAAVDRLFATPSLNSLAHGGEQAVGRALSPQFRLAGSMLRFRLHGGHAKGSGADADLAVRLLDAASGEVLAVVVPPGTHLAQTSVIDITRFGGRVVRLELLDRNSGTSYAWIGISDVVMGAGAREAAESP